MSIVNNLRIYDINRRLYPEIINSMPNVKASIINYSDFYYVSINNYLRKIKSVHNLNPIINQKWRKTRYQWGVFL